MNAEVLERAASDATEQIRNADSKATSLLGLFGAALTVLTVIGSGRHLPVDAAALLWSADGLGAAAVGVLLSAIRPRLGGGRGSFIEYARLSPERVIDVLGVGEDAARVQASRVVTLSRIAVAKYRHIQLAVSLLAAAGVLLGVALLIGGLR